MKLNVYVKMLLSPLGKNKESRIVPNDSVKRVLTTAPRSGTHWLSGMISSVMRKEVLPGRYRDPKRLRDVLDSEKMGQLCVDHFEVGMHAQILNLKNYPNLKLAILFRHPADSLISQYFSMRTKSSSTGNSVRGFEEYFNDRMKDGAFRFYLEQRIMGWLMDGSVLQIRYEDLTVSTESELARVLDFYQIPCTDKSLRRAVDSFRFEILSGGRKRGEESQGSHYRVGLQGQWKTFLTPAQKKILQEQVGDYLNFMRYDI